MEKIERLSNLLKKLYISKKNVAKNITTVITVKYRTCSMIIV